jgi:phosphatidylethanolamine/phosphatidyl-N-methylethanolamine N-methyltransferase
MPARLLQPQAAFPPRSALVRRGGDAVLDAFHFLRAWLRDPASMAAILPSGRALAELITRNIDPSAEPVLELGSGTGVFAAALIDRGIAEEDLTLVERDVALARRLARRFPHATVRSTDAADIGHGDAPDAPLFAATICGLGFLSMSPTEVEAILRQAFECMTSDGAFYLFTYGRRCSVPSEVLTRLSLDNQRVGTTYRNLPPATVFRLVRRDVLSSATRS